MASPWYRRKSFRVTVIVVALLVVALLAVPYFLNIDRYRPTIVEYLKRETGRELAIEKIRLHFLPSLRVEVLNFRVANPARFPAGDTLAVGRIDVGLAFWPLLSRRVEIDWAACDQVELNLLENEFGQTNYQFQFGEAPQKSQWRKPAAKEETEAPLVSVTEISRVALNNVSISSGKFWQGSKKVYPSWKVTGLNVEARHFDLTRADWQKQVEAEANLGQVEVSVAGLKPPVRFSDGHLAVKNNVGEGKFTLALGKLRVNGQVRVANLAKPVADFHLAAGEVNLAELTSLLAAKESQPKGPSAGPEAGPRRLLAKGTVQLKKLVFPPLTADNLQATLRLYTTRVEIDPLRLGLYRGTYKGTADVDFSKDSLPLGANFMLEGVDVAQVTAALDPQAKSKLTGTLESKMDVQLQLGASNPLATLTGQGEFAVRNGTFPGLNIGSTLATLAKFLAIDVPKGDTRFSYLGGDLRIADQRVHSQTLRLDAESLEATVQGSVGFDKTLNYTGWGRLRGQAQGEREQATSGRSRLGSLLRGLGRSVVQQAVGRIALMRIPFSIRGTVEAPKFSLAGVPLPAPSGSQP